MHLRVERAAAATIAVTTAALPCLQGGAGLAARLLGLPQAGPGELAGGLLLVGAAAALATAVAPARSFSAWVAGAVGAGVGLVAWLLPGGTAAPALALALLAPLLGWAVARVSEDLPARWDGSLRRRPLLTGAALLLGMVVLLAGACIAGA